jgi:hypothetical protein
LTTLKGAVTIAPVVRATVVPKVLTGVREQVPDEQSARAIVDDRATTIIAIITFFINKSPRFKIKKSSVIEHIMIEQSHQSGNQPFSY